MRAPLFLLSLLAVPCLGGCTGLSLGENNPNSNLGTYLDGGHIAVDPTTETTYVVGSVTDAKTHDVTRQTLYAVRAGSTSVENVLDLTDRTDPRLLFVSSGALSMSQNGTQEDLVLFDRDTLQVKKTGESSTSYWGTRLSGSKRWVGVADNESAQHDIHVIDSTSLDIHVLPHGGDTLEAMFTNVSDRLLAISFDTTLHTARLRSWDMTVLAAAGFPVSSDGSWSGNDLDLQVNSVAPDDLFSFTWVGISPDDRLAVFPVVKLNPPADPTKPTPPSTYELIALDLQTHTTTIIPNAKGPVGFTPDGSTIVSYDDAPGGGEQLKLINATTFQANEEKLSIDGGIAFFVSHQQNRVVAASNLGGQSLVLYDIDNHTQTTMSGPSVGLTEFVTRETPEQLFIVDQSWDASQKKDIGALFVADLNSATVSPVNLPFEPAHIGILPKRDELVLTDAGVGALYFVDPTSDAVKRKAVIPVN